MNKLALLVSLALATAAHAQGAPGTISFVARLADGGQPITGAHNLDVSLFDASTGGTAVWSESRTGVTIPSDGILYLDLGSVTPLDAMVFSGTKKYLEVTIDAQITTPRIVIESAPYAIRSGEANHSANSDALGTHPASFFQARVSNACSSGSAIASIDAAGSVTCQAVPSYTAGTGLALTGSVFSVDTAAIQSRVTGVCATGAIATINAAGAVTCLTAGTGLGFSTGQFNVDFATTQHAITPCASGAVLSKTDSTGAASCITAGAGLSATAASWTVDTTAIQKRVTGTCGVGSAITAIAADGSVTCGGSTTSVTSVAGQVQTNQTSYQTLTGGPSVTASIPTGHALVTITGSITPTAGNGAFMGLQVDSGATTDTQSLNVDTNPMQASATYLVNVSTAAPHTFAVQYRVNGGGNAQFSNRSIIVQAVP